MKKYLVYLLTLLFVFLCVLALSACQGSQGESSDAFETGGASHPGASDSLDASCSQDTSDSPDASHGSGSPSQAGSPASPDTPSGPASPATSGTLHVDGTRLVDENGQVVQLKGISTHGLAWYPDYVNEDCFRQLREDWHANVIRLAMYTEESGGYCSGGDQEALKALVKDGVEYATALDMYVVIDWHILSDGNPNRHLSEAKDFFTEMAGLYGTYNNVLYEICNEPNGGTSWSDIRAYAEEIIPAIRSLDPEGIILVGTPNWSQYVDQAAADPITGYDNIMYTLHFYAATHKESLRDTMAAAIDAGLPIFVSEYGICDASGSGAIDQDQADQWVRTMDEHQVSYVAWNLSNKNETSAILKSDCQKTSGFSEEDLSPAGKWLYHMLAATFPTPGADTPENSNSVATDPKATANPSRNSATATNVPRTTGNSPADNTTAGNSTASSAAGNPPTGETAPATTAPSTATAGCPTPSATLVNTWESDGKSFYQYELALQNNSGTDYTQWAVTLSFSGSIALSDGWNGEYSVSGTDNSILRITSKDYNGDIPAGGSVSNIGFIVSGGDDLEILP